jgi:hypothetical protein
MSLTQQAHAEGRTLFPKSRKGSDYTSRVLKPSTNIKLGKVMRKIWPDAKILTLTLEERKTCPSDCAMWTKCYGDNMPFAHRMSMGDCDLRDRIEKELREHKGIVAVRLHVLGDFYSTGYVKFWADMMLRYPNLRVWGYTAHQPNSDIGRMIRDCNLAFTGRFLVRFSNQPKPIEEEGVYTCAVDDADDDYITCPEQLGKVEDCGKCGLCMNPKVKKGIRFLRH